MPTEVAVLLSVFFVCLGVYTANPMFPRHNRPEIFRGTWGEAFFGMITLVILLGGLWTLVRSFLNITWYINLILLVGAFSLSTVAVRLLPALFTATALAPIMGVVGLVFVHYFLWH